MLVCGSASKPEVIFHLLNVDDDAPNLLLKIFLPWGKSGELSRDKHRPPIVFRTLLERSDRTRTWCTTSERLAHNKLIKFPLLIIIYRNGVCYLLVNVVNKIFLATYDRSNVQLHHEIQVGSIVIQLLLNNVIQRASPACSASFRPSQHMWE